MALKLRYVIFKKEKLKRIDKDVCLNYRISFHHQRVANFDSPGNKGGISFPKGTGRYLELRRRRVGEFVRLAR